MITLKTSRLILRPWRDEDLEPFAALNKDPRVMEFFPSLLTKEESARMMKRMQTKIEACGWGLWAVSVPGIADCIGYIGLNPVDPAEMPVPFAPTVEIGWRLAFDFWGQGYAAEGAAACLKYGFNTLMLEEIVSFTAIQNARSRRVMERLGMHHDPDDDFENPKLPVGHALRKHVLCRIAKAEWERLYGNA